MPEAVAGVLITAPEVFLGVRVVQELAAMAAHLRDKTVPLEKLIPDLVGVALALLLGQITMAAMAVQVS
jgi:hypothetical protein